MQEGVQKCSVKIVEMNYKNGEKFCNKCGNADTKPNMLQIFCAIIGILLILGGIYHFFSSTKELSNISSRHSDSAKSQYSTRILNIVKKCDSRVNYDTEVTIGETIVYVTLIPRDSYTSYYGKCTFQINKNTDEIIQVPSAFSTFVIE